MMAGSTGLEPAASAVTGQRSNQLNYDPTRKIQEFTQTRVNGCFCSFRIQRTVCMDCPKWRLFLAEPPPNRPQNCALSPDVTRIMVPQKKPLQSRECPALGAFRDMLADDFYPPALAVPMDLADSLAKRATALTVSDVASLLNISERQVYKLAAEGRIPCFKIGNSIRFDPGALVAWLQQKMGPVSVDVPRRSGARRA